MCDVKGGWQATTLKGPLNRNPLGFALRSTIYLLWGISPP